jgi:hypothetical protein
MAFDPLSIVKALNIPARVAWPATIVIGFLLWGPKQLVIQAGLSDAAPAFLLTSCAAARPSSVGHQFLRVRA